MMFRKIIFELWYNRPWRYIPAVIKCMKKYPYTKNKKFFRWLKAHLYLNWVLSSPSKEFLKVNEYYYLDKDCNICAELLNAETVKEE